MNISIKSIGSKYQKTAIARGPPKSAEGRHRGKGEGECFAPFILKTSIFSSKFDFFSLEMFPGWCGIIFPKMPIFTIFIIFSTFLWHISSPDQGFPWSIQADTWPGQSSNIILKKCLRICQTNKYFYQKYWVKVSKSCNSAGTPKISRRLAQRQK